MDIVTCYQFAQSVLDSRPYKPNTKRNWLNRAKMLKLDLIPMPLTDQKAFELVSLIINPNSRQNTSVMLKKVFGVSLPYVKVNTDLKIDLPPFEYLDEVIQNSGRYRMNGHLMLHGGLRIAETMVKQNIKGLGIMVEKQMMFTQEVYPCKSRGMVILPTWLLNEYVDWEPRYVKNQQAIRDGLKRVFIKAGVPEMYPHALRHAFASHYAKLLSPEALRKQMRHSDVKTTMKYYVHVRDEEIHSIMHTRKPDLRMVN